MIVPKNISFKKWASQIRIDYPGIFFPNAVDVKNWRSWASQVINANQLQNVPLPTELAYPNTEDWRKWASFFISIVYT